MHPIDESLIQVPLRCSSKREAISSLLDLMVQQGLVRDPQVVLDEILAAEASRSCHIGYGAAIPHARSDQVDDAICAFGLAADEGIDFQAGPEGARANLLFLIVAPRNDATPHIKTLARIARLVKDERRRTSLAAAQGPGEALEWLGDLARR